MIYGPSYSGKSTLAIQIAAHLPGPVLLVCPEMSAPVLKTVAVRSGADISRFHRFEGELEHWRDTADLLGALVVVVDSISKFSSAPDALDMAISWARESGGVSLSIAHESRRGKPLQRAEYEPDGVFRVTRRGKVRRVDVQKARWNGFSGTIVLGEKKRARRA